MREPLGRFWSNARQLTELLDQAGDRSFAKDYERMTKDASVDVSIQAMLTMNRWKVPGAPDAIKATMDGTKAKGVTWRAVTRLPVWCSMRPAG